MDEAALKREAWKRGLLDWKLEPHQKELVDGMRKEGVELVYADFTRRGGKTFAAAIFCESEARKRKVHIRYGTAYRVDLVKFIRPTFDKIEEDCPDDLRSEYNESRATYTYPNGSTIALIGLDKNPDGIRGNEVDIIVLDEAGFVDNLEYIYKSVIIPATARRKNQTARQIKIIVISTPARSATVHFSYQLKLEAQLSDKGFYMCKTMADIESIDETEKERLYKESGGIASVTVQREYFCKWIVDDGLAVCPTFDESKHVMDLPEPQHSAWSFVADIGGVQDKTVAYTVTWSHELQKVIFWDEVSFDPKTPTDVVLASFKELVGKIDSQEFPNGLREPRTVLRFADASGQLLVDYAVAGFASGLPPKDEFHAGLTMLRNAFYNDEVIVHPRCKLLIETLRSGLLNNQRTDYQRTALLGHCDAAAAAIYGLRVVDRVTNTKPRPSSRDIFRINTKETHPIAQLGYRGHR